MATEKPVYPEASLLPRSTDLELSLPQLARLALFSSMQKPPKFESYPGSNRLRRFKRGEVICHQGEPGQSAFYMLTSADVTGIVENANLAASAPPEEASDVAAPEHGGVENTGPGDVPPHRLATARLMIDAAPSGGTGQGFWSRLFGAGKPTALRKRDVPRWIPNDGPSDIDYETREAPIFEGDVFGEMSCLTRQPRSATVVADQDCYALEFLRSILDAMLRDEKYKDQARAKYRARVMETQLRRLSLFRHLNDEQYQRVAERIELVEKAPGTVLWDEGDEADAALVVRSGIVKVVQGYPWRLEITSVCDWPAFAKLLGAAEGPLAVVAKKLSVDSMAAVCDESQELSEASKKRLIQELNELAKTKDLLLAKELAEARTEERFKRETATFGDKPKDWMDLETRRANRVLYHLLVPTTISAPDPIGTARVRRYVGRGGTLGEIAVCRGKPRQGTCIAYAHASSESEATNVELVRVPAEVLKELINESPQIRKELDEIIKGFDDDNMREPSSLQSVSHSRRVEELGLMQGQKLMLIDLERCTRCGDCVEACINTHDDGHSRLFLDGPRIGKYLAPSSCRMCRDPVCMIGCPVGSIQQGPTGEITIREWCIGCSVCAEQCPYDSIQMQDLSLIPSKAPGWRWRASAQPPSDQWFGMKYSDEEWSIGATPFLASHHVLGAPVGVSRSELRYYYRMQFSIRPGFVESGAASKLKLEALGGGADIYLDGQRIELVDPDAEKKAKQEEIRRKQEQAKSQSAESGKAPTRAVPAPKKVEVQTKFEAMIPDQLLKPGVHLVAAIVQAPPKINDMALDLSLFRIPQGYEAAINIYGPKRAVVCDQCSSLSGNRQACVYACPHDAAIRVDGWNQLPGNEVTLP